MKGADLSRIHFTVFLVRCFSISIHCRYSIFSNIRVICTNMRRRIYYTVGSIASPTMMSTLRSIENKYVSHTKETELGVSRTNYTCTLEMPVKSRNSDENTSQQNMANCHASQSIAVLLVPGKLDSQSSACIVPCHVAQYASTVPTSSVSSVQVLYKYVQVLCQTCVHK